MALVINLISYVIPGKTLESLDSCWLNNNNIAVSGICKEAILAPGKGALVHRQTSPW